MLHRRTLSLATAGLLALSLAACDSGTPAKPTATTTSAPATATSSAAASTTATAPSAPAVAAPDPADYPGMDQQTEDGAKQFFRFYWASVTHAYTTGDSRPISNLFSTACTYCTKTTQTIDRLSANEALWGAASIHSETSTTTSFGDGQAEVLYDFFLTSHEESTDDFSARTIEPEVHYATAGKLHWIGNGWQVEAIDIEK